MKFDTINHFREIGSYFYIDPINIETKIEPLHIFDDAQYLSTCRSAIKLILTRHNFNNKVALLPGFTCHAVLKPFLENGFKVIPYDLNLSFRIDIDNLNSLIDEYNPSIILFHDYFGFDTNSTLRSSDILKKIKSLGIITINDQTQSMFSKYEKIEADYYVGSIRKWLGIPDGAFIIGMESSEVFPQDAELEKAKLTSMIYKYNYIFGGTGNKEEMFSLFKNAENILDSREMPCGISNSSKSLLNHSNINDFNNSRQINGRSLISGIQKNSHVRLPLFDLTDSVVPFYIPLLISERRAEFQKYLANNGVYATVIWGIPNEYKGILSENVNSIYDRILCLPCDQRYSLNHMQYICDLINSFGW